MSEKIVRLNGKVIKGQLKGLARGSAEESHNELLEAAAEKLFQAQYERNERRQGYCNGHYKPQPHHPFRGGYAQSTQTQGDLL